MAPRKDPASGAAVSLWAADALVPNNNPSIEREGGREASAGCSRIDGSGRKSNGPDWVTSSGLIMSRLGQVSLTKPTYRRIVLRCCSVPQAKPSPDYEYRISLRRHPVAVPLRAHGILQAGRSRPRYETGTTGIGTLENGSWPSPHSQPTLPNRHLPEPTPENRAAISIRSARPPIITVIGTLPVG